jgi:hypothetical protein
MVCADVLHRAGIPTRLRIDGYEPAALGRSFRGVVVDGTRLEAGARLLELSYGDPAAPDADPRGYVFGEHRWHMGLVSEYIRMLGAVGPEAELWIEREGRQSLDFLLTSNLRDLRSGCSGWELAKIERELRLIRGGPAGDGLSHAVLASMTYRMASICLHGSFFHRAFVEPLLDAIVGPGVDLPALDHRRLWLPLFKPGEILDACRGESKRPVRAMHVGMAATVEALVERIEPLLGADLPAGPIDTIGDATRTTANPVGLRFVWQMDPRPAAPSVMWRIGAPLFRVTQIGRVRCFESSDAFAKGRRRTGILADQTVQYSLRESGPVDTYEGAIGIGSFNEQIAQGISAAAWRLG